MTPEQLAAQHRAFLISTEKQSARLIAAEFDALKREISAYLTSNLSPEVKIAANKFIEELLVFLSKKVDILSSRAGAIVRIGQRRVINNAAVSLKRFLPKISNSIFSPDREAIEQFIGRAFDGATLEKFFARMKTPIRDRVRTELVEGFAMGNSNQQIAARIANVSDSSYRHALTVSRTEQNEAYRAASREFYQSARIKQYVWLAVLDPRTCLTCWLLHGRKFKSSKKVFSHPNCRCVLVPLTKNQPKIITGAQHFQRLETGYQQQILGAKRFEMFEAGKIKFDDFVGSRFDAQFDGTRVESFFVKNLSDLA